MGFLSLIPVKDWMYCAAIVALLAGAGVFIHHERSVGAQKIELADAAATLKTTREADARIVALNEDYKSKLEETQSAYSKDVAAGAARATSLARSLSAYQSHRCRSAVLPSATPTETGGTPSASGAGSVDQATADVIAAAEHDNAVIAAERKERDSLTGK